MILILGGTTEGRAAVRVADQAGSVYYYATKGARQTLELVNGIRLTGAQDTADMTTLCRAKGIRLLVDAAHPFASELHATVAEVSDILQIPVIRYERKYPPRSENHVWCADYEEAVCCLQEAGIRNLLALTGVNTLPKLRQYWEQSPCYFRILDREESHQLAAVAGFPADRLLFYHEGEEEITRLIERLQPGAILTKESGFSGYFESKAAAAVKANIPVFVIKRPELPETFYTVYGEEGLRRQIERLLPGFFAQRHGYTTGTYATAAAKAALLALLTGREQVASVIELPNGEPITIPISSTLRTNEAAACTVIKDAGDDPDVTHGCAIIAQVTLSPIQGIHFAGGEGVGTVTLPGLGLSIGEPAINATPRRMISYELGAILAHPETFGCPYEGPDKAIVGLTVTLSVPGGALLAERTFNPKLGIVGGISILGTSGIVRPFSTDAFIASIRKEAEVAKAMGCRELVINSGAKSERFLKARFPDLPLQAFIHYGNFIGETIRIAASLDFAQVTLGIMIGKAVKLAEGALDTHSKQVVMNKDFIRKIAIEVNCRPETIKWISHIRLARQLWELPDDEQQRFGKQLIHCCYEQCAPLLPNGQLLILLITETGEILE